MIGIITINKNKDEYKSIRFSFDAAWEKYLFYQAMLVGFKKIDLNSNICLYMKQNKKKTLIAQTYIPISLAEFILKFKVE
jgi:hypothetical protein